jgi:glycosyltransferase involved in cell wall biosynthesis
MNTFEKKVSIVTPLKDEINNIDKLIKSIESQTQQIYLWVIVQNGSTDGSREYLEKISKVPNVSNFVVLNFQFENEKYELGVKYSSVVNHGFEYITKAVSANECDNIDFIGICDADCFPKNNYFADLVTYMVTNDLAISSGVGEFENGKPDGEASNWVRGNCRLWTWNCFTDCGYLVGPSADTLSLGKAQLNGYQTKPNPALIYICREMGQRTRYDYYGYSSYYRGITITYAILKFVNYLKIGQARQGWGYLRGYFFSLIMRKERLEDLALRKYFSKTLHRKFVEFFRK